MLNIDELLNSLGINRYHAVLATIVLAMVNLIGALMSLISTWTFFQSRFNKNSVFIYYRILCMVQVIHLIQGIPYGIFYIPWYLPHIDSYSFSFYHYYYVCVQAFLVQFEDVIQMAILVDRMKIFSPRVKRYFSASPRLISLCIAVACLLINLPNFLAFKIDSIGSYWFENEKNVTLYFLVSSDFSFTLGGRVLIGFTLFFLNMFLSLIFGVTLNIVAYAQYKRYLRFKRRHTNIEIQVIETIGRRRPMSPRDREIENNLLLMSLTLCSLVIISRTLQMFVYIYFFFFYSYNNNILVAIITYAILSFIPTVSNFVYYFFNKMFRKELDQKIRCFFSFC